MLGDTFGMEPAAARHAHHVAFTSVAPAVRADAGSAVVFPLRFVADVAGAAFARRGDAMLASLAN